MCSCTIQSNILTHDNVDASIVCSGHGHCSMYLQVELEFDWSDELKLNTPIPYIRMT